MPTHQHTNLSVTWDQVAAFRLARHHLVERAASKELISVAADIGGVQAQLLSAAQTSLWARTRDLRIAQIEEALDVRALVKAACMRRTLFLVPSESLAVFVRGTARRAEKEIRWALGKGVPDRVVEAAIDAALSALDRPLTRPEIAGRVSRTLGVRMEAIHGGGWGSRKKVAAVPVGDLIFPVVDLLHLAGARGVVCYGSPRGNEPTFVRADAWIPEWQDVPQEQAEEMLLHTYLKAFGPATAADFAMWTGMTLREAREIWARQQANFAPVDVDSRTAEVLQDDLDILAQAGLEQRLIRLLPYFDAYLLGHKDREHLVEQELQQKVFRAQGWIAPVVLVDGRIQAVWRHEKKGKRLAVQVESFGAMPAGTHEGILEEAQNFSRFLGVPEVEVQIG